jgi:uncharacterized protein (TIGR00369 family)
MIEDIIAQSHLIVDSLTFEDGVIALSALRTINESQSPVGSFGRLLGIKFDEVGQGSSKASLEVKQHLLNILGIAHGGVTFSLADSTCGAAAMSAFGAPGIVTQDMQIRYHGPVKPGIINAQADVIHLGTRTIVTQCYISQEDLLIASVTATFAILSEEEKEIVSQN